jgi:DNA-binding NtrC family response regulator
MRVLLPAAGLVVALPDEGAREPAVEVRAAGGTVLVVDDEETVRVVARRILERAGFTVFTATGGADATRLFSADPAAVDVVLLDLTMPDQSGINTLIELQRIQPAVRVVLSSGFSSEEVLAQADGATAAGFVQKPYRPTDLVAAIRHALDA